MSDSQSKFNPNSMEMVDFHLVKGNIESPFEFDASAVGGHHFQVGFDLGFNIEDLLVKADFQVNISTKSEGKNEEEALGGFHFAFIYRVDNLRDLVEYPASQNGEMKIDAALGNALASISYSTVRGILLTRFQGTALRNFILPIIDPNQLLK